MKIQDYTKEMVDEKSFIDMAHTLLEEKGTTMNLYDIIDEFKALGHYEDNEHLENRIVQFYTDLNTDGRFLNVGENMWGLRDWYSVDDIEEKIAPTIQKFDILDEEDEEDKNLKLLGEEEEEEDEARTEEDVEDDEENLDDPQDEEEVNESDIVIEEDEDELEEAEELFEDAAGFNDEPDDEE
ncbi:MULTISPECIES: DNA-directed RNA polymerase subunit delta [Staphylococcus]|uniref:Probable DNA-directed RNA polymerase subunit delta n=3 Tax=Staphylococcus simulans TaxID=1286 RepID=A0ABP2YSZ6_STASI|nr:MULTISPECIES: DNA-directed RNA polymerase subunit delta [Staphylococcus]AMG95597.1 DNA-directed RNA polymerase subunit delta [Staphylococcus simulans]ATF29806.1 DNA-directed RNA polymerase subunit delta [Staphylococcus simulans]AVO01640.1 DNA-directed RNA polymerase subunit delta [Staphylococcus simulans]AVO04592.1 DNA-directed RNA polymerase subunit delta [Staphylococcus simulans]AWG18188.1 DNA-directed RNA polymerase subunit delta [Staphylococcus simulans]